MATDDVHLTRYRAADLGGKDLLTRLGRASTTRRVVVLHTLGGISPASELSLDPVHGPRIPLRALFTIAELRQSLDDPFVALEVQSCGDPLYRAVSGGQWHTTQNTGGKW